MGHRHSTLPGVTGHSPISTCFASNCRFQSWRVFVLLWSEINSWMRASERNKGRRRWLQTLSQRMAWVGLCTQDTGLYRKILRRDPTQGPHPALGPRPSCSDPCTPASSAEPWSVTAGMRTLRPPSWCAPDSSPESRRPAVRWS